MIEYRIDERIGLVVARFSGDVTYDDLIHWYEEIERDERFSNEFNGVTDMRRANMRLARGDMARISQYITERGLTLGRWAVLVEDTKGTALSMIYGEQIDGMHDADVVSSEEAASAYLGINVSPLFEQFKPLPS